MRQTACGVNSSGWATIKPSPGAVDEVSLLEQTITPGESRRSQAIHTTYTGRNAHPLVQGFVQDQIVVSHTCFGGHMDVNC